MLESEPILLIGDPRLRERCAPVADFEAPGFRAECERLVRTLERFRAEYGFGRAVAGPQIGIPRRVIAMNLGRGPFLMVNPEISSRGAERFTLWDDCMSFPWLMVRVERHLRIDLDFCSETGKRGTWRNVDQAISELVQHELDHLDGVLAIDRALDRDSIVARQVYEANRERFARQVDYTIVPTV